MMRVRTKLSDSSGEGKYVLIHLSDLPSASKRHVIKGVIKTNG